MIISALFADFSKKMQLSVLSILMVKDVWKKGKLRAKKF